MPDMRGGILTPEIGVLTDDLDRIVEFLDACEQAKFSYVRVLNRGVDRSDLELAQDRNYRQLLLAGQRIQRIGGTPAVCAASRYLSGAIENAKESHFRRLWLGLLPERSLRE